MTTKTNAHFDRSAGRLRINLSVPEAQILMYALNQFAAEYSKPDMDSKAQGWASLMQALSADIRNAL